MFKLKSAPVFFGILLEFIHSSWILKSLANESDAASIQEFSQEYTLNEAVSINPNLGTFSTSISIPYPPNHINSKSLTLLLESFDSSNGGMGVGWRWNLPAILSNQQGNSLSLYTAVVAGERSELILSQETFEWQLLADFALLKAFEAYEKKTSDRFEIYRPLVDKKLTLFIRVLRQDKTFAWIAATLDGLRYIFNANGQIISIQDRHGNSLKHKWSQGLLQSVEHVSGHLQSLWKLNIFYLDNKQPFQSYTPGGFYALPIGISHVQINAGSEKSDTYQFEYDLAHQSLVRVHLDGAITSVFNAEYGYLENPENAALGTNTKPNELKPFDDQSVYLKNGFKDEFVYRAYDSTGKNHFIHTDLNNDGRADQIFIPTPGAGMGILRASHKSGADAANEILDETENSKGESFLSIADKNGYLKQINSNEFKNLSWRRLWAQFEGNGIKVTTQPRALFFVDLNRDGRKDFIDCGYDQWTQSSVAEQNENPRTFSFVSPDGTKVILPVKRSYSNTILSVVSRLQPERFQSGGDLSDLSGFTDIFNNSSGSHPDIRLQVLKPGILDEVLQTFELGKNLVGADHLFNNYIEWRSVSPSQSQLICNSTSIFMDANRDGFVDVLTGNRLFLGSDDYTVFQELTVNPTIFFDKDHITFDRSLDNHLIVDLNQDGKYEIIPGRNVINQTNTGELLVFQNEKTHIVPLFPSHNWVIKKLKSDFGGEATIQYERNKITGRYVVKQVEKNPGGPQPSVLTQYQYDPAAIDEKTSKFLGFKKIVIKTSDSSSRLNTQTREIVYSVGNDPLTTFLFASGLISGIPIVEKWLEPENKKQSTIKQLLRIPQKIALSGQRYLIWITKTKDWMFAPNSNDVEDSKETSISIAHPSGWIVSNSGVPLHPKAIEVESLGNGIQENHRLNHDLLTVGTISRQIFEMSIPDYYLKIKSSETQGLTSKKLQKKSTRWTYWNETGMLQSKCSGTRCQSFDWDDLGRLISHRGSRSAPVFYGYMGDGPLQVLVQSLSGATRMTVDPINGRVTNRETRDGALFEYRYTPDGFPLLITRKDPSGKMAVWYQSQDNLNNILEKRTFSYVLKEKPITLFLDGFGRVENRTETASNSQVIHSGKIIFGQGGSVLDQYLPQSDELAQSWQYDSLGRVTQFETHKNSVNPYSVNIISRYFGHCRTDTTNDLRVSGYCQNAFGQLESTFLGTEKLNFSSNDFAEIISLKSLGLSWDFNDFGEVVQSTSSAYPNWITKDLLIAPDLSSAEEYQERHFEYNETGQLVHTKTVRPAGVMQSNEKFEYTEDRLIERRVGFAINSGEVSLSDSFSYDSHGLVSNHIFDGGNLHFERDGFGRVVQLTGQVSSASTLLSQLQIKADYTSGDLSSLKNTAGTGVTQVSLDSFGRLYKVFYSNGLVLSRKYQGSSNLLKKIVLSFGNKNLFIESNSLEPQSGDLVKRILQTDIITKTDEFKYNPQNYQLISGDQIKPFERVDGKIVSIGEISLSFSGNDLTQVGSTLLMQDSFGRPLGACEGQECVRYVSPDVYYFGGKIVAIHRIKNVPVLLTIGETVYAVISDNIGSIRAVVSLSKTTLGELPHLEFVRYFDSWGKKEVFSEQASGFELEKSIFFSFAGLREGPGLKAEAPLYLSQSSRVYSPDIREWLTPDKTVVWNPNRLKELPGNWHSVRYAANRPLDYVDPNGENVLLIGGIALAAGVISGGASYYFSTSGKNLTTQEKTGAIKSAAIDGALGSLGVAGGAAISAIGAPLALTVGTTALWNIDLSLLGDHLQGKSPNFFKALTSGVGYSPGSFAANLVDITEKSAARYLFPALMSANGSMIMSAYERIQTDKDSFGSRERFGDKAGTGDGSGFGDGEPMNEDSGYLNEGRGWEKFSDGMDIETSENP